MQQAQAALAEARARAGLAEAGASIRAQSGTVRAAQAVLDEARASHERAAALTREGLISKAELDAAEAARQVAESRYQDAIEEIQGRTASAGGRGADVALARQQLADTAIYAPFAGVVQEKRASIGEYLAAGAPVVDLVKVDPLRFRAEVPEREAAAVRVGQEVRITAEGQPAVTGRLARISPTISERNRVLVVEADIPNQGTLRPGVLVRAEIVTDASRTALTVPNDAVVSFAGLQKVLMVKDGKAVERPIVIGRRTEQWTEVTSGLAAGDQVVVKPGNLQSGPDRHRRHRPGELMQKLAEICLRRPVFASMMVLALVVIGLTGFNGLGVDRYPAVDVPTVSVRVSLPGASPEEMESLVTRQLEEVVNTVDGIDELRSVSGAGIVDRHRHLQARPRPRDRDPGRARPRQHRPQPPARRRDAARHPEVRQRQRARHHHRAHRRPLAARADRARGQDRARAARARRAAWARCAWSAGSSAPSTSGWTPTGWPPTGCRSRPCGRPCSARTPTSPAATSTRAAQELVLRTMGRVVDPRALEDLVVANQRAPGADRRAPLPGSARRSASGTSAAWRTAPASSAAWPGSTACPPSSSRSAASPAPTPSRSSTASRRSCRASRPSSPPT